MLQARRALVTGGAGFIGSHLVQHLTERGLDVTVLDDLSTGRLANLGAADRTGRMRFVRVDVADREAIQEYFHDVDWVFHLAALADIVPSIQDPRAYHRANVDGTVSVLEAARSASVRRFVYAASSSCYGIPKLYPTPETAEPSPRYPYALTKYVGEQYALHWAHVYGLPVVSLRLFNVFGPRARTSGTYGAVFGVFLAQRVHGQPLTVVGDGQQTRDFTFVTDVVRAFVAAAESDHLSAEILNVGSGHTYSVDYLARLIGGPITYIPKRPGEPDQTFADTSKIERLLHWTPLTSFEDGVHRMLGDIEAWQGAPVWTPESIKEATRDWFEYLGHTPRPQETRR